MKRLTGDTLVYYEFDLLQERGLRHGVFTRIGGVSEGPYASLNLSRSTGDGIEPVRENQRRMFATFGVEASDTITSWLVHGNTVRVVTPADMKFFDKNDFQADAMITNHSGLLLTLRYADCAPVLFYDCVKHVVGIAHSGWQGIVRRVLPATIKTMVREYQCNPLDIRACVGPSIGPDKFEVGEDVARWVQAATKDPIIEPSTENKNGQICKPHVNLWKACESQLIESGVIYIESANICTATNTSEWFSHREEKGITGRFGAAIILD
jgi:hypothetical protein